MQTVPIVMCLTAELEEKGVKLRMNLVEVLGFGDQMQRDVGCVPGSCMDWEMSSVARLER